MKKIGTKLYIVALVLLFMAYACTMPRIDVSGDTQEVLIRASARAAGYRFAQNNPAQAALAISHCDTILEADNPQAIVTEALTHLNDPILAATITDLISLIKIENSNTVYDKEKLLIAVGAFKEGVEMAMEMPEFRRSKTVKIDDNTPAETWLLYDIGTYDGTLLDLSTDAVFNPPGMFNEDYFVDMGM